MKPENRLISRVHEHLSPKVYREKMYNPLRRGTPDVYYEYNKILWVEYKKLNRNYNLQEPDLQKLLSAHQWRWVNRAWKNVIPCWIVVGFNDSIMIYGAFGELLLGVSNAQALASEIKRKVSR